MNFSTLHDDELLTLIKSGDHAAFTEIYNRYWRKLLAIAVNHTKDRSTAEEIVQNVFINFWNRHRYINIDTLDRYLATAVKFAVFKEFYRQKKRQDSLIHNLTFEESHRIDDQIAARFLQEYIDGIVEQLPEKCRLVFKHSRGDGLSIPEIAKEMGITEKTVEAHLTKALKVVRGNLKEYGAIIILISSIIQK